MGNRHRINKKGLWQKPSTPNQDIWQTRPFSNGVKARESRLPTTEEMLQPRPFAPLPQQPDQPIEMPDIQTKLEAGENFGYNAGSIPAFVPREASPIQAKLTIGQPNDQYEQEADSVAAQVVSQINSPQSAAQETVQREDMLKEDEEKPVQTKLEISTIQRDEIPPEEEEEPVQAKLESDSIQRDEMPNPEEEEEEPVQAKLESDSIQRDEMPTKEEEEEEPVQAKLESGSIQRDEMPTKEEEEEAVQAKLMVQRKSGEAGTAAAPDLENSIESVRGSGQSLSENIKEPMEQAFGADFSGVKVHTDGQSDQLNQSIQARAFTTGQDIFFREGQYDPGSRGGQELLAHELTHVVQQNGGAVQRQPQKNQKKQSSTLPDTVRAMLEVYGPVHYDGLIAAIHAAPVAERQAVLNDANLRSLINSRLSQEWATTVMSSLLEGSQEWKNPTNNDFYNYFVNSNGQGTLPNTATMNCWESILYAAYLANQINANWIKQFYNNALSSGLDPNITIWSTLGWSTSLPKYNPKTKPQVGQLLFYHNQGDPYPGHVAISLGDDQAISLWNQPNNVDAVQRIRVNDLAGIVYMGNPPW